MVNSILYINADAFTCVLAFTDSETLLNSRTICKQWNKLCETVLQANWHNLKTAEWPKGLDIVSCESSLIGQVEKERSEHTEYGTDNVPNLESNHLKYFKRLTQLFKSTFSISVAGPYVPVAVEDFQRFGNQIHDKALESLWCNSLGCQALIVAPTVGANKSAITDCYADPTKIADYLNDPANEPVLKEITAVILPPVQLKMVPSELGRLRNLKKLDLFYNPSITDVSHLNLPECQIILRKNLSLNLKEYD